MCSERKSLFSILIKYSPLIVLVFTILYGGISEKTPYANGLGYQGDVLGIWARDFPLVWDLKADSYQIKHMLVAFLVYVILKISSLNPTDQNIIFGFVFLHSICYSAIVFLWLKLAKVFELTEYTAAMGIVAFIITILFKVSMYTAISYDVFPQMLSLLLLYFWLLGKQSLILLLIIINAFVGPQGMITSAIFFVFPFKKVSGAFFSKDFALNNTLLSLLMVGIFLPFFIFMMSYDENFLKLLRFTILPTADISQLIAFSYLVITFILIVKFNPFVKLYSELNIFSILRAVGCYILISALFRLQIALASHEELPWITFITLFKQYFWMNTEYYPAEFFILFVVTFGPVTYYFAKYWKQFLTTMYAWGFAPVLVLIVTLIRVINCEPRHLVDTMPILIPFLLVTVNKDITRRSLLTFFILSFIFSRLWLNFNIKFPDIFFAYNISCTYEFYVAQGLFITIVGFLFFKYFDRVHTRVSSENSI